ncbi:hypothetical protein [Halalkalicoccus sp. NIPERK01]|uniref:hypothetical protein n=1 Tax=Halalkalicoccus sp. NIPERK01 TaxID=3053469 RepID=UPI00256EDCCD|nr:hypothetical protein [Halalkalicoccus sp. NIPERK01]
MSETEQEAEVVSALDRLDELIPGIADALERLKTQIVENSDDEEVIETAEEIWEILDEAEDVLDTIDLGEVPDVIDLDELPEAIDAEEVPEAIADGDARDAIDLRALKEAIEFRELWEAADLSELREEKAELEEEVDDVTEGDGDEEDDDLLDMNMGMSGAHVQFDAEDRQEKIQELIETAIQKFRTALLETHDKLRLLYEFNQEKLGGSESLNPTAVSTMPSGPLANSASTRRSTVPSQVRYSRAKNPRRIYGRRFENANTE